MKTFKHKLIHIAVQSLLNGSTAKAALSEDGLGDWLIYPYYTMKSGIEPLLCLDRGAPTDDYLFKHYFGSLGSVGSCVSMELGGRIVLPVREPEVRGLNTAEVLDFNMFLDRSPFVGRALVVPFIDHTLPRDRADDDYLMSNLVLSSDICIGGTKATPNPIDSESLKDLVFKLNERSNHGLEKKRQRNPSGQVGRNARKSKRRGGKR